MNQSRILPCIAAHKGRSCTGMFINEGREKLWLQNPVICHCSRGRAALEVFAQFSGAESGRIRRARCRQRLARDTEFDTPKFGVTMQLVAVDELWRKIETDIRPTWFERDTLRVRT